MWIAATAALALLAFWGWFAQRHRLRESEQIRDKLVLSVHEYRAEIARLRLTDAEREAIGFTLNFLDWPLDGSQLAVVARTLGPACEVPEHRIKAMLRGLLERTIAR
jgi:hypothetical protein